MLELRVGGFLIEPYFKDFPCEEPEAVSLIVAEFLWSQSLFNFTDFFQEFRVVHLQILEPINIAPHKETEQIRQRYQVITPGLLLIRVGVLTCEEEVAREGHSIVLSDVLSKLILPILGDTEVD